MDVSKIKECPDCASRNIIHSEIRDQIICRDCGLVYEPLSPVEDLNFAKAHKMRITAIPKSRPLKSKPRKKSRKKPTKKKAKKAAKRKPTKKKTTKKKAVKKKPKKSTKKPVKRKTTKKKATRKKRR